MHELSRSFIFEALVPTLPRLARVKVSRDLSGDSCTYIPDTLPLTPGPGEILQQTLGELA